MAKPAFVIHNAPRVVLKDGRFTNVIEPRQVRVMAEAEGYAMVRVKGGMPYVAPINQLAKLDGSGRSGGGQGL